MKFKKWFTMKIMHTYCLNNNIGDYALGIGMKNILREFLDIDYIAETNLQGQVFNKYFINEVINKKFDLLVIGGGGIIHGSHWPNGWFWLIEQDLIKTIKIPFIVYGAGYNYFSDEGGIPQKGIEHLKETISQATYFSVRNDKSRGRFINQVGVEIPEVPDPGFHVNLNRHFKNNTVGKRFVIIQVANDKPEYRFGSNGNKNQFITNMKSIITQISTKYKVIFVPHVHEDVQLSLEIAKNIKNCDVLPFGQFAFDRSEEIISYYRDAEFVLAMRGHGQIIPIAFNTPVISLENHPKHSGLMEKLGLQDYNVNISKNNFCEEVLSKIDYLESNKERLYMEYKKLNESFSSETTKAFEQIKRLI